MKKLIAAILSLCIVGGSLPAVYSSAPECAVTAFAADYEEITDGYLKYRVYSDHAEISKCAEDVEGEVIIQEKVKGVPVTLIGDEAFRECESITSIDIPDSVTSIGDSAFSECTSLKAITIPDNVKTIKGWTFSLCSNLESITIPDSVTSIGDSAFFRCEKLKSITIPDSVTSIGDSAFYECTSLKTITIPDNVKTIKGWTFYGCSNLESITIPDSVTSIGKCAFFRCEKLKSITIPNSVTSIGDSAFFHCQSLQSITIPDTLTRICYETFSGCSSLESITIPDSVTDIVNFAFAYCKNIKSIEVPDSVTSIGNWSFSGCSSLESITILNPDCEIFDSKEVICNGYNENWDSYFNGTIRGYEGSTAQAYAEKYGYKFESIEICTAIPIQIVPGNANGDGGVDMSDVVMVMQAYLNPAKYGVNGTSEDRITAEGEKAGDVDGKAGLTANDALIIQRYSLKLIDNF
ncbi:MAG: leucine-rich repeat protein [Ruminococcus sp.]|nr:leucine-rich repeat protein [Ruminococcus sp.]